MKKFELRKIIKEEIQHVISEGLIQGAIAGILKLMYSGKIKQLKIDTEPLSKSFVNNLNSLENNIKKLNTDLSNPEIIDAFQQVGIDVTKWPRYKK